MAYLGALQRIAKLTMPPRGARAMARSRLLLLRAAVDPGPCPGGHCVVALRPRQQPGRRGRPRPGDRAQAAGDVLVPLALLVSASTALWPPGPAAAWCWPWPAMPHWGRQAWRPWWSALQYAQTNGGHSFFTLAYLFGREPIT